MGTCSANCPTRACGCSDIPDYDPATGLPEEAPSNFANSAGLPIPVMPISTSAGVCNVINLADNACTMDGINVTGCNGIQACAPLAGVTFGIDPSTGLPAGPNPASETLPLGANAPGCSIPGVPCFSGGITTTGANALNQGMAPPVSAGPNAYASFDTGLTAQPQIAMPTSTLAPVSTIAIGPAVQLQPIGPATPNSTVQPTTSQIAAATSTPSANAGAVPLAPTSGVDLSFLTNSEFGGIPNWMLLVGVLGGLYFLGARK